MRRALVSFIAFLYICVPQIAMSVEAQKNNDAVYLSFFNETVEKVLPQYRLPQEQDYKNYWKYKNSYVYKTEDDEAKYKAPYWTKGLFNEDKIIDYAYILIGKNDEKKYLYAIMSQKSKYIPILLDDDIEMEMGLATQSKGWFLTASGKGYWEASEEDPPKVYVENHAIAFFHFEGAGSLFIWNKKERSFKRHWTSD